MWACAMPVSICSYQWCFYGYHTQANGHRSMALRGQRAFCDQPPSMLYNLGNTSPELVRAMVDSDCARGQESKEHISVMAHDVWAVRCLLGELLAAQGFFRAQKEGLTAHQRAVAVAQPLWQWESSLSHADAVDSTEDPIHKELRICLPAEEYVVICCSLVVVMQPDSSSRVTAQTALEGLRQLSRGALTDARHTDQKGLTVACILP